jgi:2-polyprenyl-6-methoxyphenol hydroxylase-like FAD-dependent oxidoreductase
MNAQVLVVGAGPVGLTMAIELARFGVRVRIVDKNSGRTDKSKALAVWSRTLELLERAGCAEAFVKAGKKVEGAAIFSGGKRVAYVDLTKIHSAYNFALMLPQSESERLLEAQLEALGVHVERCVEATSFAESGTGVQVTLNKPDTPAEQLTVDWLVGCDGAHSFVRHGLGLAFDGESEQLDWILADVHISGLPTPETQLAMYWHQDGVLAIFPITPGRYRIIADVGLATTPRPVEPALEQVQAIVDQRGPGGVTLQDAVWLSGFRINERKVASYRKGRVFVAGDAAHVHSPAGGQGMNTGMQDAFNLAWKIALVCRGGASADPLLESYSMERSPVAARVLSDTTKMTRVATMRNHTAIAVRNLVGGLLFGLAPVNEALAETLSETTIGYAQSPLNGPHAQGLDGPGPGRRVPPIAGQTPIGAGRSPQFTLLAEPDAAVSALTKALPNLLASELRPPPSTGGIWLVRPDGYVACVARETATIQSYLDQIADSDEG